MVELHSQKENEVTEGKKAKPDYLDFDGDGNEKESMKKALKDKKRMKEQLELSGKFSAKEIEELIEKL
jgi:prephenate dehydratase